LHCLYIKDLKNSAHNNFIECKKILEYKLKMKKITIFVIIIFIQTSHSVHAGNEFSLWVKNFKIEAINKGITKKTVNDVMNNAKFLPKVIEYDRFQPEFYEDTHTYIKKRTNLDKVKKGLALYKKEKKLINKIEKNFYVEKELLLALMGIETNFGKYLGKMDIISSLATLSFDKRRSAFFTNELLVLLKLIDDKVVDKNILYGSWAGAFGNFQFMPSTIKTYAIDYNKNTDIELKKIEDSFASAANYIKKIGWKKNQPCFYKVNLNNKIPQKYLNSSAKKIKNKRKFKYFKKYLNSIEGNNIKDNMVTAIITPDKDIIPGAKNLKPAYIVFENYEQILKWNRSLRFALAVCTLKNKFKNEI